MTVPTWLDPVAKVSEIVGALVGVLALVREVLDKGKREAVPSPGLGPPDPGPRGWLRLSAGLFCVPLLALVLQAGDYASSVLRTSADVAAAVTGLAAVLALGMHITSLSRQPLPLPDALRALLEAQLEESKSHPYGYSLGSAPPILEIYVDQWAERLIPASAADVSTPVALLTIAQMLEKSRNVIVLAEPGVGKSTAVNLVLRQQCGWWLAARRTVKPLEAPYGPVIPITLPADLHGCKRLPDAMARQWEQLTGAKVDAREFGRKPPCADSWLVLIDGVDQILSTPARTDLLARVGAWVAETSAPYRFMITSRPLPGGEIGPLRAEHVGRFLLRKFDAEGLERFARQWVAFRKSQHFMGVDSEPITVERFMAGIKSAGLWSLARVPLIATITALILESPGETALPASRAGLFERFILHLFTSRHLENQLHSAPPQFAVHGERGQRAWQWLLDNLRDLIEGVADLHLSVGSPGLTECAVTWVRGNAPAGVFANVPGWDDAVSGLLTATSIIVASPLGLQFAHPNFAEYLAAGPRSRVLGLETWLADARGPDSRSLALFVLARQSHDADVRPGQPWAERLTEALLKRGGTDACIAGEIIADGIEVSPALRTRVYDDLFGQLQRDAGEPGETLSVLVSLAGDAGVLGRLARFAGDPAQPDWARADVAEELCGVARDSGIRLLRETLESTGDSLLQFRILLRLEALGVMAAGERARAGQFESWSPGPGTTSFGTRAGQWYRQIAEDEAAGPGRRLRALVAMAERRDAGWAALLGAVITDPALPVDARLDAARRIMRLPGEEGPESLRRAAGQADAALEVRVPLLAAMAEAQDVQARQLLNQLAAAGGPQFRDRFPSVAAWREEPGVRSSEQPSELLERQSAGREAWPMVWGDVPPRNKNFTGRAGIFDRLRQDIAGGMTAVLPEDRAPNTLQGLGGVGKTAVAVEYAYRFRSDYDLIWWIRADQLPLVRSSLAELASQLGLEDAGAAGIDGAVSAVLDALRRGQPYDRWLLIFDNADQPEDLMAYIPDGPGDVLVTSRNPRWESTTEATHMNVFARAESREFLSRRGPRGISDSDADLLAEKLGDIPLALVQAAALLTETGMPVSDYLRLLDERVAEVLAQGTSPEYPRSMTAAWAISVAQLQQQSPRALELLRCFAFFGPEPIPTDLLRRGSGATVTGSGELLADPILLAASIRQLGRFALARIEDGRISVHRLVQALLRADLDPDGQARYRRDAQLILASGAPRDPEDVTQWPRYSELIPHVTSSAMQLGQCRDAVVRAFAANTVRYLCASGDPMSARALAENLIGQWTADTGPGDPAILSAQRHLGNALRQLGEYPEARRLAESTLSQARRGLGEQDALTLALSNDLGAALRARGDFAMALALDLETRDQCEAVLGADDPVTRHAARSLVTDYGLNSDYRMARDLGERVFRRESAGASPIPLLASWTSLAWVTRLCGGFAEARALAGDARDYGANELGPEHPATLRAALELSNTLRLDPSSREAALQLSGEVFETCVRRFGESSPAALAAAVSLGNAQRAAGLTGQALALAERTVPRYRDVYGPDHPFSHGCAGNVALLRRAGGDPAGARLLNEAALAGLDGRLGRDNCLPLAVAANLASDLTLLGYYGKARELGEDTLTRLRGLAGEDHPITLGCAANLAMDLRADGAGNRADKLAADTVNRYVHTLGPDHLDTEAAAGEKRFDFDFDPPDI